MGQNRVTGNLIFLQFTNHRPIISGSPTTLLGHPCGHFVHLILQITERRPRLCRQLIRRNVHTIRIKCNAVQLWWQTEILTAAWQNFLPNKFIVSSNLLFHFRQRYLISIQFVFFKQIANALQIGFAVGQILFHFISKRAKQFLVSQFFCDQFLGLFDDGRVAFFQTCVFLQTNHRRWS